MAKKAKTKAKRITISFEGLEHVVQFGAPGWRCVIAASHDGPYEVRALLVNDVGVVEKPMTNQGARVVSIPLPADIAPPLRMLWWITAGHNIPKIAVFMAFGNTEPVLVKDKKPLKKGESWTTKDPVIYPKP